MRDIDEIINYALIVIKNKEDQDEFCRLLSDDKYTALRYLSEEYVENADKELKQALYNNDISHMDDVYYHYNNCIKLDSLITKLCEYEIA